MHFGRGQLTWALQRLEGHSVREFVLAFISALVTLFYPLPRGHFDWHGSQVKRSPPSQTRPCRSSVRIAPAFLALLCVSEGFLMFSWPCQCHSWPASFPTTTSTISSDPASACQRRIHLDMVTSSRGLTGDCD